MSTSSVKSWAASRTPNWSRFSEVHPEDVKHLSNKRTKAEGLRSLARMAPQYEHQWGGAPLTKVAKEESAKASAKDEHEETIEGFRSRANDLKESAKAAEARGDHHTARQHYRAAAHSYKNAADSMQAAGKGPTLVASYRQFAEDNQKHFERNDRKVQGGATRPPPERSPAQHARQESKKKEQEVVWFGGQGGNKVFGDAPNMRELNEMAAAKKASAKAPEKKASEDPDALPPKTFEERREASERKPEGVKAWAEKNKPKGEPKAKKEKKPTFKDAKQGHIDALKTKGWDVKTHANGVPLKTPHATSPDGKTRLWFKSQAVYETKTEGGPRDKHEFKNARSRHEDIRSKAAGDWDEAKHPRDETGKFS